jgi:hypothetical protein
VIEFSDSSQHIYTEPFDKKAGGGGESNYGALRRVNVKTTTTTSSSSNPTTNAVSKRSATSKTKMGIKKSSRVRNLQKFPAMQDISKTSTDEDSGGGGGGAATEKVELRAKSPNSQLTSNANRSTNRQAGALVSVGLTHDTDN